MLSTKKAFDRSGSYWFGSRMNAGLEPKFGSLVHVYKRDCNGIISCGTDATRQIGLHEKQSTDGTRDAVSIVNAIPRLMLFKPGL